jgi:hypothetical protein
VSNELGINNSNINRVCSGHRNKAGGFIWRYKQDNTVVEKYVKKPNYNEKKILMLTLDGMIIKTYDNVKIASEENKILRTSITNCLKNRSKTAGGYKWKYV